MGMVWVARLADQATSQNVLADPDSAYDFINPEDDEEAADGDTVDLDKEWHCAHHLLSGSADPVDSPLSLILGNFEEVGQDNGYGPAFYIPPAALQQFHDALAGLSEDDLRKRYNPDAMVAADVYLGETVRDEGEEGFGFLMEQINALRAFAANAVESGRGAFAVIT